MGEPGSQTYSCSCSAQGQHSKKEDVKTEAVLTYRTDNCANRNDSEKGIFDFGASDVSDLHNVQTENFQAHQ